MNNKAENALEYRSMGFSVIPIRADKRPYLKWEKFQKEKADERLIQEWWKSWPDANIGIVTGNVSGLNVVDVDSEEGMAKLEELLPDSLLTPAARTPRGGWFFYFQPENGTGNSTGFLNDCDFRGEGGYIIAPPSKNYSWMDGLSLNEVGLAHLPGTIKDLLTKEASKAPTEKPLNFSLGTRDDTLFHTALSLAKGGMPRKEVEVAVCQFADSCKPPFSEKEALTKVASAFKRVNAGERNLTQEIRDWIEATEGEFLTRDVFEILDIPKEQKQKVSIILTRLVSEGLIERAGRRTGCFRRIERDVTKIDLFNT